LEDLDKIVIVSGGQAGVDRAALDLALNHGLPCHGWCPAGRQAEDGRIPDKYPLRETPSRDPGERTSWNVRDTDGTLVIHDGHLDEGTAFTVSTCMIQDKPVIEVDLSGQYDSGKVREWIIRNNIKVLNVAGPRQSSAINIYEQAYMFLVRLLGY
jgi:hypothetical protein